MLERDYVHLYLEHGVNATRYQIIGPQIVDAPTDTLCINTETMTPGNWTLYCYNGLLPMGSNSCNSRPALVTDINIPQRDEEINVISSLTPTQSQVSQPMEPSTDFLWLPSSTLVSLSFTSLNEEESTPVQYGSLGESKMQL